MFRPMRRAQKRIDDAEARRLLLREKRGVIAVNGDDGYPFAFPINYYYDPSQEKIYFHGAKHGHKVDALKNSDKVCFTVYGNETCKEGEWAPYVQSVVIFGRCRTLTEDALTENRLRSLARRYYPSEQDIEDEIRQSAKAVQLYEITIEHISGKQIQER